MYMYRVFCCICLTQRLELYYTESGLRFRCMGNLLEDALSSLSKHTGFAGKELFAFFEAKSDTVLCRHFFKTSTKRFTTNGDIISTHLDEHVYKK